MILKGRTVLITGGTSGIGFEMARRLLALDNVVVVTGRSEARLEAAKQRLIGLHTIQCDVSIEADIQDLYDAVMSRFPKLDIIINNAGVMRDIKLTQEHSLNDLVQELDINLTGPIWIIQTFLPHLLKQADAAIINVTSGLAFVPMPLSPIYSAAKAGLRAYTRSLRVQLSKSQIRVIELAPPAADSDLYKRLADDGPQSIKPMPVDVLVDKAINAIKAGRLEIVPGMAKALLLLSRIAPVFALKQLSKASGY